MPIRSPITLAAGSIWNTTHAVLTEVFDTFRLFLDTMDFLEENGDGWTVLLRLCDSVCETPKDVLESSFLRCYDCRALS